MNTAWTFFLSRRSGIATTTCALLAALTSTLGAQQSTLVGRLHLVWDAQPTSESPDGVAAYVADDAGRGTRLVPGAQSVGVQQYRLDRRRVEVQADILLQVVIYSTRIADTLRIAVFGPIASGPLVQISGLRASAVSLVRTRVEEAASRTNDLRHPSSEYVLALRPR